MKKSFFILSLMATTALTANAWAATCTTKSGNCGTNCSYSLDANCLLTINPVNEADPVSMSRMSFDPPEYWRATEIVFNGNVTSIGLKAFDGATRLTSVTIPDSVTSIGVDAFAEAYSLTSITIPDSVTSIGVVPLMVRKALQV